MISILNFKFALVSHVNLPGWIGLMFLHKTLYFVMPKNLKTGAAKPPGVNNLATSDLVTQICCCTGPAMKHSLVFY